MKLDARGWGYCPQCDDYLTPAQVRRHKCGAGPTNTMSPLTLAEAAWGPGGAYAPDDE